MYELDLNTCTVGDVIYRSLICHPTLLREAIETARDAHRAAAATMIDGKACHIADRLVVKCISLLRTIDDMLDGQLDARLVVDNDFYERIIAFTAAYRLQAISPAIAREILAR